MYESVKDSVAAFKNRQKAAETQEDKMVFRWKFVVIGLGVLLIVLIGGLSEILKQISSRKVNKYDTTFVYSLLSDTSFLATTQSMEYFLHGLNASEEIVFDSSRLLLQTRTPNVTNIMERIEGYDDLLYFIKINDGLEDHNFGMFLQKALPQIEKNSKGLNISESRHHKISAIYNLDQASHYRLNNSDDCFLYKYDTKEKTLQLVELLKLREGQINGQINATLYKPNCYGDTEADAIDNVYRLTGLVVKTVPTVVFLKELEVYTLEMKHKEIEA